MLIDAGLARYGQATRALAALPAGRSAMCADDDDGGSVTAMVARLITAPGARAALQTAGITAREYVVYSFSLLQNGLAAWALQQPGGKLPVGVSKANVGFVNKHQAELQKLEALKPRDGAVTMMKRTTRRTKIASWPILKRWLSRARHSIEPVRRN